LNLGKGWGMMGGNSENTQENDGIQKEWKV